MAGRLLSFKEYLGGADNVQVIELFPRSQKHFNTTSTQMCRHTHSQQITNH